ncbi:MAG: hypothetical protein IPM39_29450 [Chloroflexi bacterium]|nr:hypothetical protein [Chloroflexota bacterium]
MCEHKTAVTLSYATHQKPYNVLLCTWGCGEHLISVTDAAGVSREWAVSELLAQAFPQSSAPHRLQPMPLDEALAVIKRVTRIE